MFGKLEVNKKISWSIVCFSIHVALMLYQSEGTGTYAAFGTIVLTLIVCFLSGNISLKEFYFPLRSKAILGFLVMITLVTIFKSNLPSSYYKFAGQSIFFIVLQNIEINKDEYMYLKWVFVIANVAYAIVAIHYCTTMGVARYYHDNIVIFGASFDPNYIGISFIASLSFLFDNILRGKKRLLSLFMYIFIAIAVVYTASRGNMLTWAVTSVLVIFFFAKDKGSSRVIKWFWIIVICVLMALFVNYLSTNFVQQWNRMSEIGIENDNGRLELWNETLDLWAKSPIWGGGLRSMYNSFSRASHNTYLQILVDSGILGVVLMFAFLGSLFKKAFVCDKILFSVFCGMLLHIAFLDALDNRCVWCIYYIIAMTSGTANYLEDECYEEHNKKSYLKV